MVISTQQSMMLARMLYQIWKDKTNRAELFDSEQLNLLKFEKLLHQKQNAEGTRLFKYTLDIKTNEPHLDHGFWEALGELVDQGVIELTRTNPHIRFTQFGEYIARTTEIAYKEIEDFINDL